MRKEEEKNIEDWQVLHIYPKQEAVSEYEPTEDELIDQFAGIITDIYFKQYHGKKHDQ